MVESCHVRRVYLAVWKKHREIRGKRENTLSRLYLTLRFPGAYCTNRETGPSKTIKGYAIGISSAIQSHREVGRESSTFPRRLIKELTNEGEIAEWAPEFPIKRNRWWRDQEGCLGWLVTFAPLRFISTDKRAGPSTIIAHYNGINGATEQTWYSRVPHDP